MKIFENTVPVKENAEDMSFLRSDIDHRAEYMIDTLLRLQRAENLSEEELKQLNSLTSKMYHLSCSIEELI